MENIIPNSTTDIDSKKTGFNKAGVYTILASLFMGLCMISYYCYTGYIRDLKIAEVAAAIASISGLLATLAGLFFVLDNLILQRKALNKQNLAIELQRIDIALQRQDIEAQTQEFIESNTHFQKQNETLILQKNDNTFFNLIELNKKLTYDLKNENFFSETIDNIIRDAQEYLREFELQYFKSFASTTFTIRFLTSPYNYEKDVRLEFYINNVKEIVYFIHYKLENDSFYHKILYNVLFPEERYIIGMAQKLELFDFYKDSQVVGDPYNYYKHYDSLESYQIHKGYFPMLKLDTMARLRDFHKSTIRYNSYGFKIILLENFKPIQLILSEVVAYVSEKDEMDIDKRPEGVYYTIEKELTDYLLFDYSDVIKKIASYNQAANYEINFNFVFRYGAREITIGHYEILTADANGNISFFFN